MANEEKTRTIANQKSDILEARIIANYGDPGLDEDYHFDILSRYLVVMIESCDRVPTVDKWYKMLALVKRPEHLWIKPEGGNTGNPSSQKRSDGAGNVNTGLASNFSVSAIPRISVPYALGDSIKIKRIPKPFKPAADTIFQSVFTNLSTYRTYGSWHSDGSTLPYISSSNEALNALKYKTLSDYDSAGKYTGYLSKYQYEAFYLTINTSNAALSESAGQIFGGKWAGDSMIYSANGGYLFKTNASITLSTIEYEDINVNNRQRSSVNECMPLVVTTPNSFPTPRTRATGTIAYNPTYATIVKQ
jgi:hypothetical protein